MEIGATDTTLPRTLTSPRTNAVSLPSGSAVTGSGSSTSRT